METQRGLLRRPTPLTGWGVSIAAPKGMRRAPRRVRLRVISNGGFAPKPPCGAGAGVCCIAFGACERYRFCHGPAFAGPQGAGGCVAGSACG